MDNNQQSWVEIKKSAIKHNLEQFRQVIGPKTKLMAVVKSNAYGHGMLPVADYCEQKKLVDYFGVVNLHEALLLRKTGIKLPILVLSYFDQDIIHLAVQNDIDLPVYDFFMAELIDETARNVNAIARVHIKIDTGTTRLGILPSDAFEFVQKVKLLRNVEIIGIFTHFADSENYNQNFTNKQIGKLDSLRKKLLKKKIRVPLYHSACSAAAIVNKKSRMDMVRIGIGMYGLWPSAENKRLAKKTQPKFHLKPALTLKTKMILLKQVAAGTSIGYGCTHKVKKKTKIAVLPVGYSEGYDRSLGNKGQVLIREKKCKVIGRICMNLMMVDVTPIKEISRDDDIVLLGKQGRAEISADDLAKIAKTINYEIVTKISPLIPRKYF